MSYERFQARRKSDVEDAANFREWRKYVRQGGGSNYFTWLQSGKPAKDTIPSQRAQAVQGSEAYKTKMAQIEARKKGVPDWLQPKVITKEEEIAARDALDKTGGDKYSTLPNIAYPTEDPGSGNEWVWNGAQWVAQRIAQQGDTQEDKDFKKWLAEQERAFKKEQADLDRQAREQEQAAERAYEKDYLELLRGQESGRQAEQERQYKAQLLANPMSWLQYAQYTGETPAILPWMLPLMPQQYTGQKAGSSPIPGYQQGKDMTSMPELTPLSAQYWARMGPTAQQQWLGYQQAQTGARPEESLFRLKNTAPPGGRNVGLSWGR